MPGYRDRLIVPFYSKKQIVGYTCRKVKEGKPKYVSEQQPGYVFNLDAQSKYRGAQVGLAQAEAFELYRHIKK